MTKKQFIVTVIAIFSVTSTCFSQELVQWRGTDRSGIYNETGLLKEWPVDGPTLLWNYEGLNKGFTSAIIADDKIFTTGQSDSTGYVFALNLQGKLLWKVEYGKEFTEAFPGTRTTPVYYKGNLYLSTAFAEAICLNAETGKKVWSVDMKAKFGARMIKFGIVEAPVVYDNKVYFTPGGENISIVALNVNTGETIWESKTTGEKSAYCSPLLFDYKNKKYLATSLVANVVGLDASDGTFLWKMSQVSSNTINPNTPLYKDGLIYSLTGYKGGGVMMKLSDDGKSVTELWRNTTLDNQMGGAVWIGDQIIGSGHQNDRSWQCLNAKTGEVMFKTTEIGKGAVIFADGLLYCYSDAGELGIMEINDKGFTLKSKFRITLGTEQHWAHPVIHKGVLYIRHGNSLLAYSIKK